MLPSAKAAISSWLRTLYPNGVPADTTVTAWSRRTKHSEHCKPEDLINSVELLSDAGHEVYYGVCARREGLGPSSRGNIGDCRAIPGFWLDIDLANQQAHAAQNLPPSLDDALEILASYEHPPTAIVDSGFGLHAYWLFDQPMMMDPSSAKIWHGHCKAFQEPFIRWAAAKGWHVDQTGTVDRILRLPGTTNHKGDPAPRKTVTVLDDTGPRYAPNTLIPRPAPSVHTTPARHTTPTTPLPPQGYTPTTPGEIIAGIAQRVAAGWGTDETRELLTHVVQGTSWAPAGMRDATLQKLASAVGFLFPNVDPDIIADAMRPSMDHFDVEDAGKYTAEDRREWASQKIARAQADKIAQDAASQAANLAVARGLGYVPPADPNDPWAPPMPSTSPPHPEALAPARSKPQPMGLPAPDSGTCTRDEMEAYGRQQGAASYAEFQRRWILQVDDLFYVYVNGAYRSGISHRALENALTQDLAPAWPYVELKYVNDDGELKAKTTKRLMQEYGSVVRGTSVELGLPTSVYDAQSDTYREAAAPFRPLVPRYNAEIDHWLTLLGGPVLLDWVACVTRLDRQCAALYLEGPPGTGKSLLGRGLARLWSTDGPTDLVRVLGDWTDGLTRCPLLVADEHIPASFNRKSTSAELRALIGNTTHNLSRKFRSLASLKGSVRVILAGNNEDLISFDSEELTNDDMAAVAERFLHVKHDDTPRTYLQAPTTDTSTWVDGDAIAQHALHLAATRIVTPGVRFLVQGNFKATKMATQGSGTRAKVVEWLCRYIDAPISGGGGPGHLARPGGPLIRVGDGRVLVNGEAVVQYWGDYIKSDTKIPSTSWIGRALRAIAKSTTAVRRAGGGGPRFWDVNPEILQDWAEANAFDVEKIRDKILAPEAEFFAKPGKSAQSAPNTSPNNNGKVLAFPVSTKE